MPSEEAKSQPTSSYVHCESIPCDITTELLPESIDAVVTFFISDTVVQVTPDGVSAEFYGEEILIKAEENMLKDLREGDRIRVTILKLLAWDPIPAIRASEIVMAK